MSEEGVMDEDIAVSEWEVWARTRTVRALGELTRGHRPPGVYAATAVLPVQQAVSRALTRDVDASVIQPDGTHA